jgi:O-antigen ligase
MWLLVFMIFVMPFETNPYLKISDSFLGVIQDFTFIKLLGMLGFSWAALKLAQGEESDSLFSSPQARLFLAFVACMLFAGVLSGSGFLAISRYVAFLLFMPFVLVSIRTHEDLRKVIYALALTFIVVFPYALRQMFRYGGRLGTGLSETNYLGANLVLVIPIAFAVGSTQTEPLKRKLWMAAGCALVFMLFLTSSRGGFLGLLVALLAFTYRKRGVRGALMVLFVILLAALPTGLGERMVATLTKADAEIVGLEASNRAHSALFYAGLRMIADAPLTGVGPQNFKPLSLQYAPELHKSFIAHNTYLELAAETGIPVLILFLLLMAAALRTLGRATRLRGSPEARELAGWAEGLRCGLLGFMVSSAFISAQFEKMFWVAMFTTIVVGRQIAMHAESRVAVEATPAPGQDLTLVPAPTR